MLGPTASPQYRHMQARTNEVSFLTRGGPRAGWGDQGESVELSVAVLSLSHFSPPTCREHLCMFCRENPREAYPEIWHERSEIMTLLD